MLQPKVTILTKQIYMATYFENLTIKLHVLYVLKTNVKFHVNQMLFTIQSISIYIFIYNFRSQKLKIQTFD